MSQTPTHVRQKSTPDEQPPPKLPKLKVKLPTHNLQKHGSKAMASKTKDGATPAKVRKEQVPEDTEASTTGKPLQEVLQSSRFELYDKDSEEVKAVQVKILNLPKGTKVTQEMLDSSPIFQLWRAADELSICDRRTLD